jgi:YVTN family beta-propeller protein
VIAATFAGLVANPARASEYRVTDAIKGPDFRWDYLSVDAKAHRLYLARVGGVTAVDLDSGMVTPTLFASKLVHGVVPVGETGLVVATEGLANSMSVFNGATGAVVSEVPVGKEPDAVVYEPVTRTVVTLNEGSHDATVIDFRTRAVLATIPLGGKPEFPAADGTGLIYDNIEDRNEIAVIDIAARKVVRRIPLAGCKEPTGLAYDAATGLLISACGNGLAKVVDARSGTEVASLTIGKEPDAVILDTARRLAFIPSGGDGTLSVIAIGGDRTVNLVQSLKTKIGVRTGAVDPMTGNLYLPSADFLKPKSGDWPPVAPGSFKLLVVSPR